MRSARRPARRRSKCSRRISAERAAQALVTSMRGRPGTKALPLAGGGRAVGGPIALGLLAAYFGVALLGLAAAAVVLVLAAPDLAARDPLALRPVLAVHLLALVFAAVRGHRRVVPPAAGDAPKRRRASTAPASSRCRCCSAASSLRPGSPGRCRRSFGPAPPCFRPGSRSCWSSSSGSCCNAPGDRVLVASRTGVTLACVNVVAALVLGALVFSRGDDPVAGVTHDRWMLVHLHIAVLGWLAMLILTVGRTLGPMLAVAPVAPPRRRPVAECVLAARRVDARRGNRRLLEPRGARGRRRADRDARVLRSAAWRRSRADDAFRSRGRSPISSRECCSSCKQRCSERRCCSASSRRNEAIVAYVIFLLLGWAAGVTLGHLGKLLSLSEWVWWPPGPRPKQDALYPRALSGWSRRLRSRSASSCSQSARSPGTSRSCARARCCRLRCRRRDAAEPVAAIGYAAASRRSAATRSRSSVPRAVRTYSARGGCVSTTPPLEHPGPLELGEPPRQRRRRDRAERPAGTR